MEEKAVTKSNFKLFAFCLVFYPIAEFVFGNLFSLALGTRFYSYSLLPLADGYTSFLSPLLFGLVITLLFDAFVPVFYSFKTAALRCVFTGSVFAVLGPLYEWLSGALGAQFAGRAFSHYFVLPAFGGFTSFLSPVFFFVIGVAFCIHLPLVGLVTAPPKESNI